ncbi:T-cell-specific guanine nucleotide triphosphate-binding protein 2-like [Amblyraja radiata]|uniref:T-cell-specific guanine nucleotide triphosphate-binding protein 2-like n=1 Tax=Amblyraja radiata TaxID=386614 RepID=UPI0014022466|nr:T-cell-specific guanine nucleotide triphosphate-binding protein 2-like [Amblyraja radiata]XP_032886777.1 T-cell-specific guanine nucleotide triphosphate-binding protein 2-like [Amblyraja radiata]
MAQSVLPKYFSDTETRSLQTGYSNGDVVSAMLRIKRVEDSGNVPINIAVLGDGGAGKSTFINTMRGVRSGDQGAAPVGGYEASVNPVGYPYPSLPNVQLWDLPGSNSFGFEMSRYLKQVQFESYDFYIIVSQSRFRESDGELSKKIQQQGKGFYYIRSKIDNDAYSMQMQGTDFGEGQRQIRQDCLNNFHRVSVEPPAIFLISGLEVTGYDFPKLQSALASDLQKIKSNAFRLAIPRMMQEIQRPRRQILMWCIILWAFLSGALGVLQLPTLPLLTATLCTVSGWIYLRRQLGVSERELGILSGAVAKLVSLLKADMDRPSPHKLQLLVAKALLLVVIVAFTVVGLTGTFPPVLLIVCGAVSSLAFTLLVLMCSLDDRLRSVQNLAGALFDETLVTVYRSVAVSTA